GSSPLIAARASVRVWVVNAKLATVTPVHRPTAELALLSSLIVPRGALTCNNSARTCAAAQRLWADCPGTPCTAATASSVRSRWSSAGSVTVGQTGSREPPGVGDAPVPPEHDRHGDGTHHQEDEPGELRDGHDRRPAVSFVPAGGGCKAL